MNEIEQLRKQIPSFKCKPGCHDCCGPVVFSKWEWDQVVDKRMATNINCPYIGENGCDIYEHRPIVCRMFGVVKKMQCPHRCGPHKLLTEKKESEIMNKYHLLFATRAGQTDCLRATAISSGGTFKRN